MIITKWAWMYGKTVKFGSWIFYIKNYKSGDINEFRRHGLPTCYATLLGVFEIDDAGACWLFGLNNPENPRRNMSSMTLHFHYILYSAISPFHNPIMNYTMNNNGIIEKYTGTCIQWNTLIFDILMKRNTEFIYHLCCILGPGTNRSQCRQWNRFTRVIGCIGR